MIICSQRPEVPVFIAWVSMHHYAGVLADQYSLSQLRLMVPFYPSYRTLLPTVDSVPVLFKLSYEGLANDIPCYNSTAPSSI